MLQAPYSKNSRVSFVLVNSPVVNPSVLLALLTTDVTPGATLFVDDFDQPDLNEIKRHSLAAEQNGLLGRRDRTETLSISSASSEPSRSGVV
jgi:hypothetical protein